MAIFKFNFSNTNWFYCYSDEKIHKASRFILKEKISWKKYLMIIGVFLCVMFLAFI